jgi:single stranded DNA-binding protein
MLLSTATETCWKDDCGQWQSQAKWHRMAVWGEQFAEYAADLKRGAHVLVEGGLRSRGYENDGVKHRTYECRADSIVNLDRPRHDSGSLADGKPVSKDMEVPC